MSYANSELKDGECEFCGQEKKCLVQDDFGVELVACPDCLFVEDRDY